MCCDTDNLLATYFTVATAVILLVLFVAWAFLGHQSEISMSMHRRCKATANRLGCLFFNRFHCVSTFYFNMKCSSKERQFFRNHSFFRKNMVESCVYVYIFKKFSWTHFDVVSYNLVLPKFSCSHSSNIFEYTLILSKFYGKKIFWLVKWFQMAIATLNR